MRPLNVAGGLRAVGGEPELLPHVGQDQSAGPGVSSQLTGLRGRQ